MQETQNSLRDSIRIYTKYFLLKRLFAGSYPLKQDRQNIPHGYSPCLLFENNQPLHDSSFLQFFPNLPFLLCNNEASITLNAAPMANRRPPPNLPRRGRLCHPTKSRLLENLLCLEIFPAVNAAHDQ